MDLKNLTDLGIIKPMGACSQSNLGRFIFGFQVGLTNLFKFSRYGVFMIFKTVKKIYFEKFFAKYEIIDPLLVWCHFTFMLARNISFFEIRQLLVFQILFLLPKQVTSNTVLDNTNSSAQFMLLLLLGHASYS